jgi:cyclopropane fatty-acyl-phospholipid synthase-like methyltransferase
MSEADRAVMRDFYDELGDAEWTRLEDSPRGRVSLEVHRRFLARFIEPGMRVLEVGAGPGRFTMELAALGSTVAVTDFSPVQLELNGARVGATPWERAVESRDLLDVCDTTRYGDGEFDAVVAYGGPLSYAFERVDEALAGLLRITRPGGPLVASVMSTLGSWRFFLAGVLDDTRRAGEEANDLVLETGDLRHFGTPHVCKMFRSHELSTLVERLGGRVLAMSASNWASLEDPVLLEELERDGDRWARFLGHEVTACSEPGALDGGTHLLFAASHERRAMSDER